MHRVGATIHNVRVRMVQVADCRVLHCTTSEWRAGYASSRIRLLSQRMRLQSNSCLLLYALLIDITPSCCFHQLSVLLSNENPCNVTWPAKGQIQTIDIPCACTVYTVLDCTSTSVNSIHTIITTARSVKYKLTQCDLLPTGAQIPSLHARGYCTPSWVKHGALDFALPKPLSLP